MKQWFYRSLIELTNGRISSFLLRKFTQSRFSKPFIRLYARAYRINEEEMIEDMASYQNLHSFFSRRLKSDARSIHPGEEIVVCPVDGVLEDFGPINDGCEMTVKGKKYLLSDMLGGVEHSSKYKNGMYMILYLSPAHYHRIHSPIEGEVIHSYSLGKKSYPVNRLGLKYGKDVLAKNFRTVTELKHGTKIMAIVKIGAMFINSVVITNNKTTWAKGEEIAYFSFGSTVILLFRHDHFLIDKRLKAPCEVRMGEALGRLKNE